MKEMFYLIKKTTTNFDVSKRERRSISVGSSKISRLKGCNFSQDLTLICFEPLVLCQKMDQTTH